MMYGYRYNYLFFIIVVYEQIILAVIGSVEFTTMLLFIAFIGLELFLRRHTLTDDRARLPIV